ncbi:hypothetical protein BJ878DRAFT_321021 [Calycina marina]|uniref:Uncharacterized protein n=1 Tax=Calycina marina TaxID=1763456 RepID=A0A9P7Z642_9HELO|nr:hypothetical protein BJ878DRAFT_321021 [Calycina marina]
MAAIPSHLTENPPRSSAERRALSHGRGGAGNIGSSTTDLEPPSLDTPHLKGDIYTTGRGGTGNMAKNNDPDAARRAQDVIAAPRRPSNNDVHVGRGGAANVFRPSTEDLKAAEGNGDSAISDDVSVTDKKKDESRGLADKGKEWLFGRKKN